MVKLKRNKNTSAMQPLRMENCKQVTLPMKQHIGDPCVPCVAPGDHVLAGLGGAGFPAYAKLQSAAGYNCGACGYPGCGGYAEAIAAGKAAHDLCRPGKDAVTQALAAILEQG